MIKLLKHFKLRDWILVLLSLIFIVAQVFLDLKLPEYIKEITELVTTGGKVSAVWEQGGYMLAIAFGSAISSVIVGFFAARIAVNFAKTLRLKIFEKTTSFSMAEINKFSTASLITRATNDTSQIERTVAMGLQVMIKAPILATWAVLKILNKNWQWSVSTAVSVGIILVAMLVILVFALPKVRKVQTILDELNKTTRETVSGVRVVRAYNANDYQQEKSSKVISKLSKTELHIGRIMSIISPVMTIVLNGLTLAIYWLGGHIINGTADHMQKISLFGDMMVFSSYAMQVIFAFMMIIMIFVIMPRVIVSSKRINEVLQTESSIKDGNLTKGKNSLKGVVEFKNVSFKYPDAEESVLNNISFIANKGETVAFIGSTGSGKSTLINLIPRFYDATDGEVLVSGVNVKDYKIENLHNKIGYVSQNSVIFSGTVEHNLKFGKSSKKITNKDMQKALEIAQGKEFVEKLDKGYKSEIAQGGINLSGGQKQRVSIARAIARKPEILVFDDSFSALDYKTDKKLRKALKKEIKDTTILVVAQRIGTIKEADKIIVLDSGVIAGEGTHKELLQTCEIYKEIALSQFSEKELSNEIK